MFRSIDTCQNKVSADQYCVTISWAQAWKLTADQVLIFDLIAGLTQVISPKHKRGFIFARFLSLDADTQPYYNNNSSYTVNAFRVQVENGLENVFFPHFLLLSIQFDIS